METIFESVSHFSCIGYDVKFNYDEAIEMKLNRYQSIRGTIRRNLGRNPEYNYK